MSNIKTIGKNVQRTEDMLKQATGGARNDNDATRERFTDAAFANHTACLDPEPAVMCDAEPRYDKHGWVCSVVLDDGTSVGLRSRYLNMHDVHQHAVTFDGVTAFVRRNGRTVSGRLHCCKSEMRYSFVANK